MATNYLDSSEVAVPEEGSKQTVFGFAEMQGPYYSWTPPDLVTNSTYLVISVNPFAYTPLLNYQFVECALRGWPGVGSFKAAEYPVRVVLKNNHSGKRLALGNREFV
jgi:hypothetical protein